MSHHYPGSQLWLSSWGRRLDLTDLYAFPKPGYAATLCIMHLNYLLAFDGVIASRGGIPLIEQGMIIGAIGCSGGTDSQDEIVGNAGAAVINQLPAGNE